MERRTEPAMTVDGLRPPQAGYPYFAHADRYRLQSSWGDYSVQNAWWLADACLLSYGDAEFVEREFSRSILPTLSWQLDWLGKRHDHAGIVLRCPTSSVLVFRGTRLEMHEPFEGTQLALLNLEDLWTDSQFLPMDDRLGGRVHSGFLRAFERIRPVLDSFLARLKPGEEVILAGHSLGAAMATLAAAHLQEKGALRSLYTFGSPRVGNRQFASRVPQGLHYRIVCGADWVTEIPPAFMGYVHAGEKISIPGSPQDSLSEQVTKAMQSAKRAFQQFARQGQLDMGDWNVTLSGLIDHSPVFYATRLWNMLLDPSSPT